MSGNTSSLRTPLGELFFTAEGVFPGNAKLTALTVKQLQPTLPPGMEVMACYGVLVQIEGAVEIQALKIAASLAASTDIQNGAETGEGMEAQGWSSANHIVMVGTEDSDSLVRRLGSSAGFSEVTYDHTTWKLSFVVPRIRPNVRASFHMVVAWNPLPEPEDCSCWYCVDQAHASICNAIHGH